MEITKLIDYIKIFDNFLEKEKADHFENVVKSNFFQFKKAAISNLAGPSVNEKIRKTEYVFLSNNQSNSLTNVHWCNFMGTKLIKAMKEYSNQTDTLSYSTILDMQILKYDIDGFYKIHVDHGASTPRTISFIYFINEDYQGGELIFCLPQKQNVKIEVKKNRCIVWPSNFLYPHQVLPVKEGIKYSLVSWAL